MNKNEILTNIAQAKLHIETLETQKSDGLDFHDVSVWGIKAALEAAYDAGAETPTSVERKAMELLEACDEARKVWDAGEIHPDDTEVFVLDRDINVRTVLTVLKAIGIVE
jgi:hypothetical protein